MRRPPLPYKSPLQNAHAERVICTLPRECLDHMLVMGKRHARRTLGEFVHYYNEERTHQALGADSPVPREEMPIENGRVIPFEHLGGLHHSYRRVA